VHIKKEYYELHGNNNSYYGCGVVSWGSCFVHEVVISRGNDLFLSLLSLLHIIKNPMWCCMGRHMRLLYMGWCRLQNKRPSSAERSHGPALSCRQLPFLFQVCGPYRSLIHSELVQFAQAAGPCVASAHALVQFFSFLLHFFSIVWVCCYGHPNIYNAIYKTFTKII
jgi:hypothetical protein